MASSPLEVWRQYNGRAGIEHVIRELRHGYGLQQFCCQDFWATEAVLSMVVMAYNLRSDWYLRLADQAGKMLRGEIPVSSAIPISPP